MKWKKWVALTVTAAMLAGNFLLPAASVHVWGSEPVQTETAGPEEDEALDPGRVLSGQDAADEGSGASDRADPGAGPGSTPEAAAEPAEAEMPDGALAEDREAPDADSLSEDPVVEAETAPGTGSEDGAFPAQENEVEEAGENSVLPAPPAEAETDASHAETGADSANDLSNAAQEETEPGAGPAEDLSEGPADAAAEGGPVSHPSIPPRRMTSTPTAEGPGNAGNDDLFAAYVNRELGLEGDLRADTGDYGISTPAVDSNHASNSLHGYGRQVYGILLEQIRDVADGRRTGTSFEIPLEELGLENVLWTQGDLGVPLFDDDGYITDEAWTALDEEIGIFSQTEQGRSLKPLLDVLLADCPYDLYWYDKTQGTSYMPYGVYVDMTEDGEEALGVYGDLSFDFYVAVEYSATGAEESLEVDASIGGAVQNARDRAASIVENNKSKSDFDKLSAYKDAILDLTAYNNDAASDDSTSYGDPWQLIWVFDGDESTNVVCEGYSKAFQYLCDLSSFNGIFRECITVTGTMSGGTGAGGHMWNIVQLRDGRNFMADLTNCDDESIGQENNRTGLFLVGVRGTGADEAAFADADGNVDDGYLFYPDRSYATHYSYDAEMLKIFSREDLTLAAGRVTASTTASGSSSETHEHIYIEDPAVEATCYGTGLTAGNHCAICGYSSLPQEEIEKLPHTPDENGWQVTTEPTYTKEGVETTHCTVCGAEVTRSVPKLIPADGIYLDEEKVSLHKGDRYTLTAAVHPADADDQHVIWKSSNTNVVRIESGDDPDGKTVALTAVGAGTAAVTASTVDGSYTDTCTVTVTIPVTGLTLNKNVVTIQKGDWLSLRATVAPSDATDKTVTWTSSDTKVASVSGTGVVRGNAGGEAEITVTTKDGGFTKKCTVTVTVPLTDSAVSAVLNLPSGGYVYDGEAKKPSVTVRDGMKVLKAGTDYTVAYSGNIDAGGDAEAASAKAVITGKGIYTGTLALPFSIAKAQITEEDITLAASGLVYDGKEKTPAVTVTVGGRTLDEGTDYTAQYRDNTNAGTGTVTVTAAETGNYTGEATVPFTIGRAAQKLTLTAAAASVKTGASIRVTAGGAKEGARYTFTSSNTSTATVTASGAAATVKGLKAGTVTITVTTPQTANYKGGRAAVTVKVLAATVAKPQKCEFLKWSNSKYTGCVCKWTRVDQADGYETLLSWTDGSHASRKEVGPNVLQRTCSVASNHVSQFKVRAFVKNADGTRTYSQWSNVTYITPSPATLSSSLKAESPALQVQIKWNIIYGCNGYNVFLATDPNGTWYWNQSTTEKAGATSAVISKYRGSRLKKGQRYYVRIVTRRKRNGVFCTVPMPSKSAYTGWFVVK